MFHRTRAPVDPVTIFLDGEPIPAERGEPLAAALLASDKTILARSPKLHRPRGPSCFRGACDGCLARVDGVPNVMTCLRPARGGERIDAQNVVGSRKADLLRVTDWFFARGIDHHHLMAGVPGLSDVMQTVAGKVAGLGRLPSMPEIPRPARRIEAEVVVVGGGVSGVAAASRLGAAGRRAILVDDGIALGGALACSPRRASELLDACPLTHVEVLSGAVVAGFYQGDLLVASGQREALLIRPRATIFATGAHDGTLAVPGNDMPGIFSARALTGLLHRGLAPDGPTAIVGEGFWADELARALGDAPAIRLAAGAVVDVRGTAGVRTLAAREGAELMTHKVAAVGLALRGAPAFELPAQAGAETRFDPGCGYTVVIDEHGRCAEGVWAVGECTGAVFEPEALRAAGERVADEVIGGLG
jgi:sarcosine oxidase subunit alpha